MSTIHGRDVLQEIELAATSEGSVTAVRVRLVSAMGAYLQLVTPGIPLLGAWIYGGCYDIPAYSFQCTGVFTHTTPTDAYRGAGRPEATYAIERVMDALATELGMDPLELRRRNFITEFPATIASGLTIDSGDYNASLDKALELLDLEAVRAEQAERRERGDAKQLGIGFSTYVEMCGLAPSGILGAIRYVAGGWDAATIRCLPSGTVQVLTGTSPHGQGHETAWSQITADELGYAVDEIEVLHGDTSVSPLGMDTYGSRSLTVGGIALHNASSEDRREGADARRAPARRRRERARATRAAPSAPATGGDDEGVGLHGLVGAQPPARLRARPRGDAPSTTRRTSAGRVVRTRPWSRSTPRRATCSCCGTSRSTTSARSSTR